MLGRTKIVSVPYPTREESCFLATTLSKKAAVPMFSGRLFWDGQLRSPIYYHLVGVSINAYLSVSFMDLLLILRD